MDIWFNPLRSRVRLVLSITVSRVVFFLFVFFLVFRGKECEVMLFGEPLERLTVLNVFFPLTFIVLLS